MTLPIGALFAVSVAYLLLLFGVAYATERGLVPTRVVRHPLTYALSLGVYATSWTYSGSVGFAQKHGYGFLTIYLGVTLACLLVPVLWEPVLRLCREHQLTSLADLFASSASVQVPETKRLNASCTATARSSTGITVAQVT